MKSVSQSFEAASVQPAAQNVNSFNAPFEWRLPVIGLCVFVGYYLAAKVGFALTFKPYPVSVLWPPNSILVAALLLTPRRIWWFVLLAAFPAHCAAQIQSHVPPLMILCWFVSNSFEAVIGAGLTRYLVRGPIQFTSLRNAGIFCLCVVFAGPFLVVVPGCGVCQMECLGSGQLLGPDPNTIFFERSGGINSGAVDRNVGDERNSDRANSWPRTLAGGMPSPFRSAFDQFRCSL